MVWYGRVPWDAPFLWYKYICFYVSQELGTVLVQYCGLRQDAFLSC